MGILTDREVQEGLTRVRQWSGEGDRISRTFKFTNFPEAMRFVTKVASVAEATQHHPDIDIRWNLVKLVLTTHDEGGLTAQDFEMADRIDQISR